MKEVTLEVKLSSDLMSRLIRLRDRINKNLAPVIKLGKDQPVNVGEVAAALVELELCGATTNKVAISTMFALEKMRMGG